MFKSCLIVLTSLSILACSSNDKTNSHGRDYSPNSSLQNTTSSQSTSKTIKSIDFFDSSIFDQSLERALNGKPKNLVINFPSAFNLNDIPTRLEKWLVAMKENGGDIQLVKAQTTQKKPEEYVATRGFLFDAVELALKTYNNINEGSMYDKIKGYDTQLIYSQGGIVNTMEIRYRER